MSPHPAATCSRNIGVARAPTLDGSGWVRIHVAPRSTCSVGEARSDDTQDVAGRPGRARGRRDPEVGTSRRGGRSRVREQVHARRPGGHHRGAHQLRWPDVPSRGCEHDDHRRCRERFDRQDLSDRRGPGRQWPHHRLLGNGDRVLRWSVQRRRGRIRSGRCAVSRALAGERARADQARRHGHQGGESGTTVGGGLVARWLQLRSRRVPRCGPVQGGELQRLQVVHGGPRRGRERDVQPHQRDGEGHVERGPRRLHLRAPGFAVVPRLQEHPAVGVSGAASCRPTRSTRTGTRSPTRGPRSSPVSPAPRER